jgi:archaellum component FlaG (FlaF/FlaG flagellin family)
MSDSDSECLFFIQTLFILAAEASFLTERQNRRWAVRRINKNKNRSAFMNLISEMKIINDQKEFFSYTRMNLVQFN